ncbi:hypothetical protein GCM10027176_29940 [Actinoallomurus bryophytorum]|uniref:Uncharacterized protein n=1 Tax=Actinoallomurus bryophytorum TaxID=1490222 RepID=A0A543CGD9_9ACTN|nr:hypothetical protein [Actinoallomurus bryophytorum]TQL96145.1 hypothetical protein FB559_1667 [Actinoallomurus bryophytorum]
MPQGVVHSGREAAAFVGARGMCHRRAFACECGEPVATGLVQPLGERQGGERAGEHGRAERGAEDGDRHSDRRQAPHHTAGAAVRHARTVADIPR